METKGVIKHIYDPQQVSDNFTKREFILTTDASSPYPQHVTFQMANQKAEALNQYSPGDEVTVFFNLRGREVERNGETKYYTTLDAWKITA
jgi:hypothetical protein